jgi:hypothetical protein
LYFIPAPRRLGQGGYRLYPGCWEARVPPENRRNGVLWVTCQHEHSISQGKREKRKNKKFEEKNFKGKVEEKKLLKMKKNSEGRTSEGKKG